MQVLAASCKPVFAMTGKEALNFIIRIGSTPTFPYFDLYLYAAHYVYSTPSRHSNQYNLRRLTPPVRRDVHNVSPGALSNGINGDVYVYYIVALVV